MIAGDETNHVKVTFSVIAAIVEAKVVATVVDVAAIVSLSLSLAQSGKVWSSG
jgi:hypothetical protein